MNVFLDLQRQAGQLVFTTARCSQALAIEVADRLVSVTPRDGRPVAGRLLNAHLNAVSVLVGDPDVLVEQSYDVLHRLVGLHREFAHRLLDVVDTRHVDPLDLGDDRTSLATILPLHARGAV